MSNFINTEQMERAACTFDNADAVDQLQRIVNQFENVVYQMNQVVGRIEQLESNSIND